MESIIGIFNSLADARRAAAILQSLGIPERQIAVLAPHTRDAAVVIVAQRVSTIINADQILVLEDGHAVGLGTHRELLETCPTYAEIVASQMAAQEEAA